MNSIPRSLASIGFKLHHFSSTVQLSELVYVFLRLQQMKRSLQAPQSPAPRSVVVGAGPAFCVRSCDGRYFPLIRARPRRRRYAKRSVRQARPKFSSALASRAPPPQPANATPIARTPLPIGRRCALTAPATATVRSALRQSISRWMVRCAGATRSPLPTGSSPIAAYGSVTTKPRISLRWARRREPTWRQTERQIPRCPARRYGDERSTVVETAPQSITVMWAERSAPAQKIHVRRRSVLRMAIWKAVSRCQMSCRILADSVEKDR